MLAETVEFVEVFVYAVLGGFVELFVLAELAEAAEPSELEIGGTLGLAAISVLVQLVALAELPSADSIVSGAVGVAVPVAAAVAGVIAVAEFFWIRLGCSTDLLDWRRVCSILQVQSTGIDTESLSLQPAELREIVRRGLQTTENFVSFGC